MSFFILRTGEQRDAPPGSAAFAGAMFRATALALPGIDLSLYVGPGHAAPAVHQAPNGDTIAALGSLLIDGASADRALRGLLERFDSEDFTWQGLLGTHILIVYKNATAASPPVMRAPAERAITLLQLDVDGVTTANIVESGLHEFLDDFQKRLIEINTALSESIFRVLPEDV